MKDLRRFLTKKKKNKNIDFNIVDFDCINSFSFLAFCIYNSFQIKKDYTLELAKMYEYDELNYYYSLFDFNNIHFEDNEIESGWIKHLVLDCILPDYEVDEFFEFVEDPVLDATSNLTAIDEAKQFLKWHKIPKIYQKETIELFEDNDYGICDYAMIVVKSKHLVKIYNDIELRHTLEKALCSQFVRPNTLLQSAVIYEECCNYDDGDFLNVSELVYFVNLYKQKFGKKKRCFKQNISFASNVYDLSLESSNAHTILSFMEEVLNTFDTKEQVMF